MINTMTAAALLIVISVINKQFVAIINCDIFPGKEFKDQLVNTAHMGIVPYIVPYVNGLKHKTGEENLAFCKAPKLEFHSDFDAAAVQVFFQLAAGVFAIMHN
jgi:hypothetical protein